MRTLDCGEKPATTGWDRKFGEKPAARREQNQEYATKRQALMAARSSSGESGRRKIARLLPSSTTPPRPADGSARLVPKMA